MVTTNIQSFSGNVEVAGTLSVTGNLISTTGVDKVDLSTDTTNALRPVIFSTGTTGSQSLKTDPGITYNPSTKTFTLTDNITASNATVSDYLIHKDNTNTYLGFPADDTIAFTTGGGEKMRITSTGNLGVGSAAPAYKLHVVGNTYVTSNLTVGTANLHVDTLTGNVGIGTTTPIFTLDVHGTSNVGALTATTVNATTFTGSMSQSLSNGSYLTGDAYDGSVARTFAVDATTDSTANKIVARDASGNVYADRLFTADYLVHEGDINTYFGFPSNDTITFTTTGDERMRVDQYGNVAIGTTSAPYKLNVAGTANVGALSATTVTFSDDLAVGTNKFFVDVSSSNVGIGTSEPAYTLDVTGPINLTSNIVMSGEVFIKAHDATSNHVAIGPGAGQTSQGTNAVAVGYLAGQTNQHDNTVVLNASGSALDTEGTGRTYIKPLRVATVASNVMTYDQTTGEVMDSGGLISNKFAVVSEQPPSALTGATTTIQGHGRYKVTSSATSGGGLADWNIFNKVAGNGVSDAWSTGTGYYDSNGTHIGDGTLGGVDGEWLKLEMPYKTKLRHISLTPRSTSHYPYMPEAFTILGSNDDSSWTTLKALTSQTWTSPNDVKYVIDASASYKYYAIVVEETNGDFATIGELRLFTESFSVDGGIVTTTAASGLETGFTEHPVAPMTDYNTYVEGHGTYEADASSKSIWFHPTLGSPFDYVIGNNMWESSVNWSSSNVYNNTNWTTDVGGTQHYGEWLQLKLPYSIILAYSEVYPRTSFGNRGPGQGVILGSNDGEHWYKITEFSGKTYTNGVATIIDVNATTPYQYFRMTVNKLANATSNNKLVNLSEWRLFSATGVTKMDNVLISGELAVHGGALQTSHIKWPKVPLKANESEGYVASASSEFNAGDYAAWHAFEDKGEYIQVGTSPAWASGNGSFSSGSAQTSRTTGSDTFNHEWLQIQLPQAIQLSYFNIDVRPNRLIEHPKSGFMYGSNDGVTWTKLVAYSDLTYVDYQPTRVNVQSTTPYTYYRLAVTVISGSQAYVGINELQLFESTLGVGTSATTAKLTVDGGLGLAKGSQVFAGSDVITEFPAPTRVLKYPRVNMTGLTTGIYTASASENITSVTNADKAFDGDPTVFWHSLGSFVTNETYSGSTSITDIEGIEHFGVWLKIDLGEAIKLQYFTMYPRIDWEKRGPYDGQLLGSNDGTNWYRLTSFQGLRYENYKGTRVDVNSDSYFKQYALIIQKIGDTNCQVSEWELYGIPQSDPEATGVDIIHRSIINKPNQDFLAVYYEARDPNSYSFADSTKVYDLSGNGQTGTITGNNGFDAEYNAWVFDGSGDYISGTLPNSATGEWVHSISVWVKVPSFPSGGNYLLNAGIAPNASYPGETLAVYIRSSGIFFDIGYESYSVKNTMVENQWHHVVFTYTGGVLMTGVSGYVDGTLRTQTNTSGTTTLNLTTQNFRLGTALNGGSPFNGSIANFRLFGKALSADQVRELYEYDAPRFGHRQNLVSLHKGNLGVGVAHPTSRFEVAGADGLQEYPPKAMTGYETYMEGHGVFRASASTDAYAHTGFAIWKAFNKVQGNEGWHSGEGYVYGEDTSPMSYITNAGGAVFDTANVYQQIGGINGQWIKLECPQRIVLKSIVLQNRTLSTIQAPKDFTLLGSNNDGDWEIIKSYTGVSSSTSGVTHIVNANESYTYFVLVVTRVQTTTTSDAVIGEWRLFGTPAPSSLEDGHLTLGKALTLPRVSGHPAGAETPRAESLVVHYDTTVDSVVSGSTVVDISGNGSNGTLTNGAAYSSTDRALTFDGVDDYVSGTLNNPSGAWVHTVSVWFKNNTALNADFQYLHYIGSESTNKASAIQFSTSSSTSVYVTFFGNYLYNSYSNLKLESIDQWRNITYSYEGGNMSTTNPKIYVDGKLTTGWTLAGGSAGTTLDLNANSSLKLATRGSTQFFDGSIANFKIWGGVALTAEEVAQEYALGRTGKSLNLTDTSLCLGGTVPRAQLDVRGVAKFDRIHAIQNGNDSAVSASLKVCDYDGSNGWKIYAAKTNGNLYFDGADYTAGTACIMTDDGVGTTLNFTGQHRTFIKNTPFTKATELEGLIVSADNNKYIKMSGGIEAGSNAITTNESLPLVSLSNIAADKKCFGVISGSEDPDTRQEQYGNFVSVNRKELGDTRVYINSVGEGAMWVTDINGPLESGDYITTSNVAGYGQKQDSEFLANYTVAKITMDCDFEPATQPIQRIKQSNVIETHYTGMVSVTRGVPYEFVTTTVTADDEWSNVSISPSDVTYAEWSNLEANVQNTYTLTYTQTSNVVYDVKYTKTTTANVTQSDPWDNVYVDPPNVSYEEWSNLEANVQNTYTLTYTKTTTEERTEVDDPSLWNIVYYQMVEQEVSADYPDAVKHETVTERLENALDEHGQLQWEDHPTETEKAYKIRYLDASGQQTDEANCVHKAAFVGVTYHCG
jgi:hypothetical protein